MRNNCPCGAVTNSVIKFGKDGWYTTCPVCGEEKSLDIPTSFEGKIAMLFVAQPEGDPHKYFIDGLRVEDLKKVEFVSVEVFDDPKQFMKTFYKKANFFPGYYPDSMWYFVFDDNYCICSGACDPYDEEIFTEYFGERLKGFRPPKAVSPRKKLLDLLQKKHKDGSFVYDDDSALRNMLEILTPTPSHQQDCICPVCGEYVDYNGDQEIVDDNTVVSWHCPRCGCDGKQGSRIIFENHFEVYTSDGHPVGLIH